MKKTFLIVSALAALFLAACNKIEKTEEAKEITDITFTVASPDTKAVKTAWAAGDEIMIFFQGRVEVGQQAKLRYDGSVWELVQKPQGLSYTPGTGVNLYYSIHYPGSIIYNGQDDNRRKIMNYRGGIILVNKDDNASFDVSAEGGVIELGRISLKRKASKAFQVVVPGIRVEDNYTLSVTCNGRYITAENNYGGFSNSYGKMYYPYPLVYGGISYGGGIGNIYGTSNPDGVEFFFPLNEDPSEAAASLYKYVFALSDGTQLYYYTIAKTSDKTIADKSAIELPAFDGKGAKIHWKTTL